VRDATEGMGKFRIVSTVCDFYTEYQFEDLESAVNVAKAHRAENPEHPDNAILVFKRKKSGMLCHGRMRNRRRKARANSAMA
jgi:hypothetical protein